jgi:hypothetical protein
VTACFPSRHGAFLYQVRANRGTTARNTNSIWRFRNLDASCGWCSSSSSEWKGVITDNDSVEQEKHVKYTDLIANAVMLQNVVNMTAALRRLNQNGEDLSAHTIAVFSPYLRRHHIKRFGDYVIDLSNQPEPLAKQMALPLRALLQALSEEAAHQKHHG